MTTNFYMMFCNDYLINNCFKTMIRLKKYSILTIRSLTWGLQLEKK